MIDKEILLKFSKEDSDFLRKHASIEGNTYTVPFSYEVVKDVNGCLFVKEIPSLHAKEVAIDFCDFLDMHKYEFETKSSEELFQLYLTSNK